MKKDRHYGFRINNEMLYKIKYIAEYEGRSMNGQITYLINQCIKDFERDVEKIEYNEEENA